MFERKKSPTNEAFLEICKKNGIEFENNLSDFVSFDVIDDAGKIISITKDFNIFSDYYAPVSKKSEYLTTVYSTHSNKFTYSESIKVKTNINTVSLKNNLVALNKDASYKNSLKFNDNHDTVTNYVCNYLHNMPQPA